MQMSGEGVRGGGGRSAGAGPEPALSRGWRAPARERRVCIRVSVRIAPLPGPGPGSWEVSSLALLWQGLRIPDQKFGLSDRQEGRGGGGGPPQVCFLRGCVLWVSPSPSPPFPLCLRVLCSPSLASPSPSRSLVCNSHQVCVEGAGPNISSFAFSCLHPHPHRPPTLKEVFLNL